MQLYETKRFVLDCVGEESPIYYFRNQGVVALVTIFLLCPPLTSPRNGVKHMQWVAPSFEEVNLSCEINSYVNAEL